MIPRQALMDDYLRIPMRAVAKARPRGKGKQFYMPADYMAAKVRFADELRAMGVATERYADNVKLWIVLDSDEFWVRLESSDDVKPKHMRRSDIDNVAGFVADALQDARVIKNDSQIVRLDVRYEQETT